MLLVHRNHSLGAFQERLGLDLQCEVGAIVEAAAKIRQKDMKCPARLSDQRRSDKELASLPDGILAPVRPAGV
jgi:hypothetical protein